MALEEYMSKSKDALARLAARADSAYQRESRKQDETMALVGDVIGAGFTAPVAAALSGYVETRLPNKDGTRLSLGPVPFPALVGVGATLAGVFLPGARRQLTHLAAGQFGLAAGTMGRAYGVIHKAKADAKKKGEGTGGVETDEEGIGDDWTEAEAELLAA